MRAVFVSIVEGGEDQQSTWKELTVNVSQSVWIVDCQLSILRGAQRTMQPHYLRAKLGVAPSKRVKDIKRNGVAKMRISIEAKLGRLEGVNNITILKILISNFCKNTKQYTSVQITKRSCWLSTIVLKVYRENSKIFWINSSLEFVTKLCLTSFT